VSKTTYKSQHAMPTQRTINAGSTHDGDESHPPQLSLPALETIASKKRTTASITSGTSTRRRRMKVRKTASFSDARA
jgi:hypothetical protein